MKSLNILFLLILIFFLNSCGFKNINSLNENIKINKIEINGDKKTAYFLKNNILIISNNSSSENFDVFITLSSFTQSKIKDNTGKTTKYSLTLNAELKLRNLKNQNYLIKNFSVSNNYDVAKNHSDTINNEKNANNSNIAQLSDIIIKYIQLINI